MRNLRKILCMALALAVLSGLSGCHIGHDSAATSRVVTQVSVAHREGDKVFQRHYSDPKKMELFLNYLRLLRPYVPAREDPEELIADSYQITLHFSDGAQKTYCQWGDSYISVGYQPWLMIPPELGSTLGTLFSTTAADE